MPLSTRSINGEYDLRSITSALSSAFDLLALLTIFGFV